MSVRRLGAIALLALTLSASCKPKADDGTTPIGAETLPPLELRDDTPNLLLTWIDEKGDTHVEMSPADVPPAGRADVRAVVGDREDGTRNLFYVADLGQKRTDGTYAVKTMPRREWEALIEKRRAAHLASISPPAPRPAPSAAASGPADVPPPRKPDPGAASLLVIIYGASWCKPCHEAAAHLRSLGVPFVEKDIDASQEANAEMQEKLRRAGQRAGTIPVIDVHGEILLGYSRAALDRALKKARRGTVL